MNNSIFKAYDVRGIVPEELDVESSRAIGAGFAHFLSGDSILVGRDMRASSVELSAAFIEGVNSQGVSVVEIGLCSTDMMYFASGKLNMAGAMFTASHNPAQYNGIKFCKKGAAPVSLDTGLVAIRSFALEYLKGNLSARLEGRVENHTQDLLDDYVAHVCSFIDISSLKRLKVISDTANGMGGLVVPAVLSKLPIDSTVMYGELDGTFPNHPADPIQPENLVDLKAMVLSSGADIGLAFDGDADRVFLVDDKAAPMSGSLTTSLVARAMLEKSPGSTVLYNLICSKAVPEIVSEAGGIPVKTRVGHSFIKEVMAETNAVFGGEHSGHYYFRDNYRADSGLIAALVVLEALSKSGQSLSEFRGSLERYADSGEVNTKVRSAEGVLAFIENAYLDRGVVDHMDGLTVDLGEWWFNVRPSNTEPLLRLNLEARSPAEVAQRLQEVLAVIAKADDQQDL